MPISLKQLASFAAVFALIGGYALWYAFASPNPNLKGDLNNDNTVNVTDLSILLSYWNTTSPNADINTDGAVNVTDLSILLSYWGQSISAPAVNFSASPTTITSGQSSTLTWSTTGATSCTASGAWSGSKSTSGTASTGALSATSIYNLSCTGAGGTTNKTVTVTVGGSTTYQFDDEFDGASGAPANPNYWVPLTWHLGGSETNTNNVFQDGQGHLVLRARRDTTNSTGFSGAWINTFSWDGHPAKTIKVQVVPPFHVETRMLMANVDGAWPGFWTNDATSPATTTSPMLELDISEERTTYPTEGICHSHVWGGGSDLQALGGSTTITNMRTNWHIYWANVYADHAVVGVDSQTCGTLNYGSYNNFRVSSQSFLYQNFIANPTTSGGSWASGGKQPAAADPGPWDTLVDYVRVNTL